MMDIYFQLLFTDFLRKKKIKQSVLQKMTEEQYSELIGEFTEQHRAVLDAWGGLLIIGSKILKHLTDQAAKRQIESEGDNHV